MSQANIWDRIHRKETIDDLPKIYKFMKRRCLTWSDCLYLAREKFDKYFSHKVPDRMSLQVLLDEISCLIVSGA